jgi:hypothetical protein
VGTYRKKRSCLRYDRCLRAISTLNKNKKHLTKSLMVSIGVSALGRTGIHFIEAGAKINGDFY